MKHVYLALLLFALCFSCIDKKPELSAADYKKKQEDYERLKTELSKDKTAFYNENKDSLMAKIELFKKLKDTATVYTNINEDETFFLDSEPIKAINFHGSADAQIKAVFLTKGDDSFTNHKFNEPYSRLYVCAENEEDKSCSSLQSAVLENFLALKYAFVIDGYRLMEPDIEGEDGFSSGLFLGSILVYDLQKDSPIYEFTFTASNSDEVKYMTGGYMDQNPQHVLNRDFEANIIESIKENCKKHFNFVTRY